MFNRKKNKRHIVFFILSKPLIALLFSFVHQTCKSQTERHKTSCLVSKFPLFFCIKFHQMLQLTERPKASFPTVHHVWFIDVGALLGEKRKKSNHYLDERPGDASVQKVNWLRWWGGEQVSGKPANSITNALLMALTWALKAFSQYLVCVCVCDLKRTDGFEWFLAWICLPEKKKKSGGTVESTGPWYWSGLTRAAEAEPVLLYQCFPDFFFLFFSFTRRAHVKSGRGKGGKGGEECDCMCTTRSHLSVVDRR